MFGLDKIDDSMWLTVGFYGLSFGERDAPWDNLQNWYEHCQKDADLIRRAVDLAYSITPESCAKPQKKEKIHTDRNRKE